MDSKPLNPKQQRFCQEYVIDSNGAQAATRAGYAPGSAKVTASRMLTYANVRERIDQIQAEYRETMEISVDSLTSLLIDDRKLAHDNKQAGAAVSASEKIAKLHGYMKEHIKVDVTVAVKDMSDAEVEAERDRMDRGWLSLSGRKGVEEKIAHYETLLVRFDNGEFDDILPPQFARASKSPPLVVLGASEFQSTKQ